MFNALNLADNTDALLADLRFGQGDGLLRYYFYNYRCPRMRSADMALVLQ